MLFDQFRIKRVKLTKSVYHIARIIKPYRMRDGYLAAFQVATRAARRRMNRAGVRFFIIKIDGYHNFNPSVNLPSGWRGFAAALARIAL